MYPSDLISLTPRLTDSPQGAVQPKLDIFFLILEVNYPLVKQLSLVIPNNPFRDHQQAPRGLAQGGPD